MIWLPSTYEDIEFLRTWVRDRLDTDETFSDGYAIAILRKKTREIKCAFIISSYTGNNIIMSGAVDSPFVAPTEVAKVIHIVFSKPLSVLRITALINEMNKRSVSLMEHLGFIHEGTLRDYEEEGTNTFLYGLIRSDFYGGRYGRIIRKYATRKPDGDPVDDSAGTSRLDAGSFWSESISC